ncbi:MAG: DNA alkylation repair protein [Peptoniphilaceae bacterium]
MNTHAYIYRELSNNIDNKYREFNSKLIPNIDKKKILGVRTPILRKISNEILNKFDYGDYLKELPHKYYEENNIHGFIIAGQKDFEKTIYLLDNFLPFIDNWATCDSISLKIFKKYPKETYSKIMKWLDSDRTYTKRFAIVSLLKFYLDENFTRESLNKVVSIKSKDYYVNMAIAWYLSYALIKQYNLTIKIIESKKLGEFVQNKTIEKAIESRRIEWEVKNYLKKFKIRG